MRLVPFAASLLILAAPAFAGGLFDDDDCRYTAPRRGVTSAAGVTRVVIHAGSGSLRVDGVPGATQIQVDGTACTSDEDFLSRMSLTMRRSGSELHIETKIPDKTVIFGFFSARIDFTVTVPAGVQLSIDDGSGWIKVSNVGTTTIDDGSGSIEARNIRGNLTINDGSGATVVDDVSGNLLIEDDSGEIVVKNVAGKVEIEDDSGAMTVSRVQSLHVREDGSGSISAHDVRGDVLIDFDGSGSVTASDVGGNFTVHRKTSGSIDHVRVAGKVDIPERKRRD